MEFKNFVLFYFFTQYYSDSNDAESWMKEKMYVVSSEDYGRDEQSAMVSKIAQDIRAGFQVCESCVHSKVFPLCLLLFY